MDDATTTAMIAKQKRGKGNQQRTTDSKSSVGENNLDMKKNVVCYFCKKRGHISRYCLKRKNASRSNISPENPNVENSVDVSAFIVTEAKIIADLLDRDVKNIWFLDSGASKHMTFRREWLYDFHETTNETVSLGDSTPHSIRSPQDILI